MSVSNFEKEFTNPLLKKLQKERRREVEKQTGQLLILKDVKVFVEVVEAVYPEIVVPKTVINKALSAAKKKALELQNTFSRNHPERFKSIVERVPSVLPSSYKIGRNTFIVTNFTSSMKSVKDTIINTLVKEGVLTEDRATEVSPLIHKGHGVRGTAVSQVAIAGTLADLSSSARIQSLRNNFNAFARKGEIELSRSREIRKLFTSYEQVVTKKGDLKASYFSIVDFQVGRENTGIDAREEKAVKQIFERYVKQLTPRILKMKGSSSLEDKIDKVIFDSVKPKKARVRVRAGLGSTKLSTSAKVTKNVSTRKDKPRVRISEAGVIQKYRVRKGVSSAPLELIGALNTRIHEVVADNMHRPALRYRTGRLARSVKITDVVMTPKGFPSIGYTYMKYPYQTFEPGYKQGSVEFDPRRLIDKSIREIAAEFAIGRFYTRRE